MSQRRYQQMLSAKRQAAYWLALGNLATEISQKELAERHYARSQKWHDRMNKYLGNS